MGNAAAAEWSGLVDGYEKSAVFILVMKLEASFLTKTQYTWLHQIFILFLKFILW